MLTNLTEDERFEEILNQMEEDYIKNHPDEYRSKNDYNDKGDQNTMKTFLDRYYHDSVAQGISQGVSQGTILGAAQNLVRNVEALMQNLSMSLQEACASINSSVEEYEKAKKYPTEIACQKPDIPSHPA